ncbi:hypothetical protein [Enterovibrio coralii]|uniref:Uncharacterized protein n=1 Tax=Enterovibrio coralii TaxID=294935 RepID=A0A135I6X0_9GAMM|nr:hypothetical protein [Enterovibrio coralii]KXF81200.1 hypothetical protein ATN88_00045 [Enterovibrio coralii]
MSTGGGGISGGPSSAKNGDFHGGSAGGQVTFNNHQGASGSNRALYVIAAVVLILGVVWLKQ